MAETALLLALKQVYQFLNEEARQLKYVHKEFEGIKDELESIQAFLKDADRRASDECDTKEGIKAWVKQLTEASFRIEDVIDEYVIHVAQRTHHLGFIASFQKIAGVIKTLKPRLWLASEIQDIKLSVRGINERGKMYNFQSSFEHGSSSSTRGNQNGNWFAPRLVSLFIEESEVVGFENPREELVGLLVNGATSRTVLSVVGMGGLGKTTLAKSVFDNHKVKGHFDSHAFITVSQSYTIEALLRDMMKQLCEDRNEPLPQGINTMDKMSLITMARNYLKEKRYAIFFDDVWKVDFWDEIQLVIFDSNKGSRILITTRNLDVANYCKKDSHVDVLNLQSLPPNKAWELFCKKAFQYEFNGICPLELHDIAYEIVQKCEGLPLAIVAIAGLLSTKDKTVFEWKKIFKNLSFELDRNPHLANLTRILAMSYEELPHYLRSCILYFGVYPEDYSIRSVRLIRQWIAEGFIEYQEGKVVEDVAEEYLTELIHRSLVQVSTVHYNGKVKKCKVHDMVREMIIRKMKDMSFCHVLHEGSPPMSDIMARRLAITTSSSDVLRSIEHSRVRSIYIFKSSKLPEYNVSQLYAKSKLLKVLDLEGASLDYVPNHLGNLFHLRFLSFRNTKVKGLPNSIGKLQNLETLDLKETLVQDLPSEINKLTKLRYLLVCFRTPLISTVDGETGVRMKKGVGSLTNLQKLYHVEADHGGIDLIIELRKLRQLRKLGLKKVKTEYGKALCDTIQELNCLESLHISAITEDEIIDLQLNSSPPQLRRLHLFGRLEKLPDWIPRLQYLVRLSLRFSKLKDDPLKKLKNLPVLLRLAICCDAYDGEMMHFEVGFLKLKRLFLIDLNNFNSIVIDDGALPALEKVEMMHIPQLQEMPSGFHFLKNLEKLHLSDMRYQFNRSIDPNDGHKYWVIKHVPFIYIREMNGPYPPQYRTIHHT